MPVIELLDSMAKWRRPIFQFQPGKTMTEQLPIWTKPNFILDFSAAWKLLPGFNPDQFGQILLTKKNTRHHKNIDWNIELAGATANLGIYLFIINKFIG